MGLTGSAAETRRDSLAAMFDNNSDLSDDEDEESPCSRTVQQVDSASETETPDERYWRYVNSSYSDVSEPDMWLEIQKEETIQERYQRYASSARNQVSDVEFWDYVSSQATMDSEA